MKARVFRINDGDLSMTIARKVLDQAQKSAGGTAKAQIARSSQADLYYVRLGEDSLFDEVDAFLGYLRSHGVRFDDLSDDPPAFRTLEQSRTTRESEQLGEALRNLAETFFPGFGKA